MSGSGSARSRARRGAGRGARRDARRREAPTASPHVRRNRRFWERTSAAYERRHEAALERHGAEAWGLFRLPESELRLLGPVRGLRLVELGAGACRWSVALARRGASCVALDLSRTHLRLAHVPARGPGSGVHRVEGDAERLPFRDASFDLAFCDWGALTFADPGRAVPEAARVLRPGGRLVFATASPLRHLAQRRDAVGRIGPRLLYDYFDLGRIPTGDAVEFQRSYAGWIGLFRAHGLAVERLVEARIPRGTRTRYLDAEGRAWARRWPMESIWCLRREAPLRPTRPR